MSHVVVMWLLFWRIFPTFLSSDINPIVTIPYHSDNQYSNGEVAWFTSFSSIRNLTSCFLLSSPYSGGTKFILADIQCVYKLSLRFYGLSLHYPSYKNTPANCSGGVLQRSSSPTFMASLINGVTSPILGADSAVALARWYSSLFRRPSGSSNPLT